MSAEKTVWRHVMTPEDVAYNDRETDQAVRNGMAAFPRRPACSVPLLYGYRWVTRKHIPLEFDIDSLEHRDIDVALADKETFRFLKRPDGSLMERKRVRVWRIPLARPRAISAHQGERAAELLEALPLKQLIAGIGAGGR